MYVGKTGEENRAGRDRGYRNHRVEGVNSTGYSYT